MEKSEAGSQKPVKHRDGDQDRAKEKLIAIASGHPRSSPFRAKISSCQPVTGLAFSQGMSMYYLHRNGETFGPLAPGRLRQMWQAGEIGHTDQVCEHGTEEWMPAEVIAGEEIAAPDLGKRRVDQPRAKRKQARPRLLLALLISFIGLGVMIFAHWALGLIVIIMGAALDRVHYVCSGCGNRLEKTSTLCPACRAVLK